MICLDAQQLSAARPGKQLFADLSITISTGDRVGIVGLNGCGKSTLLSMLAGKREPDGGEIRRGKDVRIAMLEQNPQLPDTTVLDAVQQVAEQPWEAAAVLEKLGMGALTDRKINSLSGGQAKRVSLAAALVTECDVLILDEPTNHLDIDAIAWLENRLANFRSALILVTHDRHVLDALTNKIVELDRGKSFVHEGGYDSYLEAKADREEKAASAEATRRNLARKELAWLRRGAPARTSKPKARIDAAVTLIETRAEPPARQGIPDLWFGTPRLGDKVIELNDVAVGYSPQHPLFEGLQLQLDPRERLGIVGPNGVGKSTLLDVIAGRLAPLHGTVDYGSTVKIGYYDQVGVTLDPKQRVRNAVAGDHRQPDWQDGALCESFWFDADAQWAPIELLSGGERRRLQLLLVLAQKPNVLLLDEPTNDLDIETLRVLEEFLDEWPGALLVVSHDRAFLERTVADVIVMDGHSTPSRRPGGYAAWEASRRQQKPIKKSMPSADNKKKATNQEKGNVRSPSTLRFLLKDAEKALEKAQKRRDQLTEEMAVAAGESDHQRLAQLGAQLTEAQKQLDEAEMAWLTLAEESEEAMNLAAERRK